MLLLGSLSLAWLVGVFTMPFIVMGLGGPKEMTKDKKHPGYFRCCAWDDCPGNKGSRPVKTKAEERLIKAAIKHASGTNAFLAMYNAANAVRKERKKK